MTVHLQSKQEFFDKKKKKIVHISLEVIYTNLILSLGLPDSVKFVNELAPTYSLQTLLHKHSRVKGKVALDLHLIFSLSKNDRKTIKHRRAN